MEVLTVRERGWSGIKNSALLRLAAGEFDVFLTMDRGVEFQQNLRSLHLGVLIIRAPDGHWATQAAIAAHRLYQAGQIETIAQAFSQRQNGLLKFFDALESETLNC